MIDFCEHLQGIWSIIYNVNFVTGTVFMHDISRLMHLSESFTGSTQLRNNVKGLKV